MHYVKFLKPECSNDGDTLAYPSWLPLRSSFFAPLFFLYGHCIFLPAWVKLFQDANGRFIRSRRRKEEKERKREGEGRKERGKGRERAIDRAIRSRKITKPPALRRVPNMKYAIVKRIHRIFQITTPMWSVAKRFRARRFFVAEKLNESKILYATY